MQSYYKEKANAMDWYSSYSTTSFEKKNLLEAAVRKHYLDSNYAIKKDYEADVKSKIKDFKTEEEKDKYISEHTSYMGIIDEAFHTLIAPKVLGPEKFWRVVQAYTRAYASLAGQLLIEGTPSKEDYIEILQNPHETYRRLKEKAIDKKDDKSYYSVLRNYNNVNVITSNYTPLCQEITEKDVAYIHGKMSLFESAKELAVYDTEQTKIFPDDILFPFLSLQSGVKPIICRQQIEEYAKMVDYLDKSDVLLIVGFKLNEDDNHINSLIRTFYQNGKRILYFSFNSLNKEGVLRRLRLDDDKDGRVEIVEIDKKNCIEMFEQQLSRFTTG